MTFTFSLENIILQPNENRVAQLNLTLTQLPATNNQPFNFDIVITATA